MANEYKEWSTEKLIQIGARLKYLLREAHKLDLNNNDIRIITKGYETLFELRAEYSRRVAKKD